MIVDCNTDIPDRTAAILMGGEDPVPQLVRSANTLAAAGADVVFTDVWASMGQEEERAVRAAAFAGYQVNDRLMTLTNPGCMVQHCLPAHLGRRSRRRSLRPTPRRSLTRRKTASTPRRPSCTC